MKRLLITNTLFLILSGIACSVYADDVYNFYFQKNPPAGAPGTANVLTPVPSTGSAAVAPVSTQQATVNQPASVPTALIAPVATLPPAPPSQIGATIATVPVVEPEFRHWNIGVGLEQSNEFVGGGGGPAHITTLSVNLGCDFSKNLGLWAQVYLLQTGAPMGIDSYGNPITAGGVSVGAANGGFVDASAAAVYTPLIVPLFGDHNLRISFLVGAITSQGFAYLGNSSILGTIAQPMWGAMASYNFSDRVSIMVDTKDYEQVVPLNYVSDQLGFNLAIKL